MREGDKGQRIGLVFDVYLEISIRNAGRQKPGSGTDIKFSNLVHGHRIKMWRNFLSEADNKAKLIEFLISEWKSNSKCQLIEEISFVIWLYAAK